MKVRKASQSNHKSRIPKKWYVEIDEQWIKHANTINEKLMQKYARKAHY